VPMCYRNYKPDGEEEYLEVVEAANRALVAVEAQVKGAANDYQANILRRNKDRTRVNVQQSIALSLPLAHLPRLLHHNDDNRFSNKVNCPDLLLAVLT